MGMDHEAAESEKRFAGYIEQLGSVMGHADRKRPFKDYCTGLVMPLERKSVEPLAAVTAPPATRSVSAGSIARPLGKQDTARWR